jgi:hypothetical protein
MSRNKLDFRNGSNQQLNNIIKDRGPFCSSFCHWSISLIPRRAFPPGGRMAASHSWGFKASTFICKEGRDGREEGTLAFQVGVLRFTLIRLV